MKKKQPTFTGRTVPVLLIIIAILVTMFTGCSQPRNIIPGPSGETEPEEDWYSGMIEVDVGNGETRWIRAYDNVPVSTLKANQFKETDGGYLLYTGDEYTALQGIDVSTFQGEIDWAAVAADGIDFAMLRIGGRGYGSGEIYEDDSFPLNFQGATENGIRVGGYFFSQAVTPEEAREEADYAVSILKELPEGSVTMPIAFDWETVGDYEARTADIDEETLTACAKAFCDRIAEAGYQPMVYAYRYLAYEMYDLEELQPYGLWISTLDGNPDFYYAHDMWQYTENGVVNGIQTRVDLNLYFIPAVPATEPAAEPAEQTGEPAE